MGVAEDEVKYGAAARVAQLDTELLDTQQDMAACLHTRQAACSQDVQEAKTELTTLQVLSGPTATATAAYGLRLFASYPSVQINVAAKAKAVS